MNKKYLFTILLVLIVASIQFFLASSVSMMSMDDHDHDCVFGTMMQRNCATTQDTAMFDHHIGLIAMISASILAQGITIVNVLALSCFVFMIFYLIAKLSYWRTYRQIHKRRFLQVSYYLKKMYLSWLMFLNRGMIFPYRVGV